MSTANTTTALRAESFSCPSCVSKIEKRVRWVPGVEPAQVHFASSRILIVHDPAQVGTDALVVAVREAGYVARPAAF